MLSAVFDSTILVSAFLTSHGLCDQLLSLARRRAEAADCLEEAVANRIVMGLSLPLPSPLKKRQYAVPLPAQTAAKAALYVALQEAQITKAELAKRLGCDEKEVRRLLDPRHPSKLPRIESALAAVGQRLVVGLQAAA